MPPIIDANHRGPLVNIALWISLVASCIAVATKVWTKTILIRRLQLDDAYSMIALAAGIGNNIAISLQVAFGLGSHNVDDARWRIGFFSKALYSSTVLYVVAIYITKLVALQFFLRLVATGTSRSVIRWSIRFLMSWVLVATIVAIFQCQIPMPWQSAPGKCINQTDFWIFNSVVDFISQVEIAILPVILLQNLQTSKSEKYFAMLCFTPNLLTVPLAVLRVKYFMQIYGSPDHAWNSFAFSLTSGLQTNVCILLVCMPFCRPFIDSLVLEPQVVTDETRGYLSSSRSSSNISSKRGSASSSKSVIVPHNGEPRPGSDTTGSQDLPRLYPASSKADIERAVDREFHEKSTNDGSSGRMVMNQIRNVMVTSSSYV